MHRDFYHNEKVSELRSNISDIRNELILSEIREELLQSRIELKNKETAFEDTITNTPYWLPKSEFSRTHSDLIAKNRNGEQIIFENYFSDQDLKSIETENGLLLKGSLIKALAGPIAPMQYAQVGNSDTLSIGEVSAIKGKVQATRVDGNVFTLSDGDPVFKGDIIETIGDSSVGLVFLDKTTMSLSDGGKMVLDELVFDPTSGEGNMAIDIVEGAFSFVSGEIAKTGSDAMTVSTPVATLGIRGTTVAGKAAVEGNENSFTLLQDAGGTVGQISVSNAAGTQTLSQVGATTSVTSINMAPPPPIILSAEQIQANYGTALEVLPPTPAVAPQPEPQSEPQEEQVQAEESSEESDQNENVDEETTESTDEVEVEESVEEEISPEGEEGLDDETIEEDAIEGIDPEGEILPEQGELDQESESGMQENNEVSAEEVFETALLDGANPEEAMAAAAEASGAELTPDITEPFTENLGGSVEFGESIFDDIESEQVSPLAGLGGDNFDIDSSQTSLDSIREAFSGEEIESNFSTDTFNSGPVFSGQMLSGIGSISTFSGSNSPINFGFGVANYFQDSLGSFGVDIENTFENEFGLDVYGPEGFDMGFTDIYSNIDSYEFSESEYFFEDASLYGNTNTIENTQTNYTEEQETTNTISGTEAAETLSGTSLSDTIEGKGGNDTINAGEGNDVIKGGEGIDKIKGGLGDDQFYYGSKSDFYDIIYDFGLGNDTLLFDATVSHNVYTKSGFINDSTQHGSSYDVDSNGDILPNVINFKTDLSNIGYKDKNVVADHFTSFAIQGTSYENVSGTNDFLIITGDGTNSAVFLWQDLFNDHGMFVNEPDELSLVALLNDFDNDTLTVSDIMLTPPI